MGESARLTLAFAFAFAANPNRRRAVWAQPKEADVCDPGFETVWAQHKEAVKQMQVLTAKC